MSKNLSKSTQHVTNGFYRTIQCLRKRGIGDCISVGLSVHSLSVVRMLRDKKGHTVNILTTYEELNPLAEGVPFHVKFWPTHLPPLKTQTLTNFRL